MRWWRPGHFLCCSLAQDKRAPSTAQSIQLVGSVCLFIQIGIIRVVVQIHNNNRTCRVPESQFYRNPEMRRRSVNDDEWEDALWRDTIDTMDTTPEGGNPGGWHIIGGVQCTGGMQTGQSDRATGNLMPPLDVAFPGAPPTRRWQCCSQGQPGLLLACSKPPTGRWAGNLAGWAQRSPPSSGNIGEANLEPLRRSNRASEWASPARMHGAPARY